MEPTTDPIKTTKIVRAATTLHKVPVREYKFLVVCNNGNTYYEPKPVVLN